MTSFEHILSTTEREASPITYPIPTLMTWISRISWLESSHPPVVIRRPHSADHSSVPSISTFIDDSSSQSIIESLSYLPQCASSSIC